MLQASTFGAASFALPFLTLLAPPGHARIDSSDVDAVLKFEQTFHGVLDVPADEDVVELEMVALAKFTAIVKREGGGTLKPDVALFDANFSEIDISAVTSSTKDSVSIKNFVVPAHGTYYLRVRSANDKTGEYRVAVEQKPVKKPNLPPGTISNSGEVDTLTIGAPAGAELSGTIERTSGNLEPLMIEIVSPLATLVSLGGKQNVKLNGPKDKLTIDGIELPLLGDYQLRITGKGGTKGGYKASLKITPAKPEKGDVYEVGHPDPGPDDPGLRLLEVYFGRGLAQPAGDSMEVKSPYSLVKTDPVTGLPIPGTFEPLFPGAAIGSWIPFSLDDLSAPPIVPRNAVLVMRFNKPVSQDSLKLTSRNQATSDSPVEVTVNGAETALQMFVVGNDLILNPVTGGQVGFAASPLAVDGAGNPTASPLGYAALTIAGGTNGLKAVDGNPFVPREDLLGSPDSGGQPIPFNPGSALLDFVAQSTSSANNSYSGFLPDETAPRIIREQKEVGTYQPNFANPSAGDLQAPKQLTFILTKALDTTQNGGKGEYAGGAVRLRPAGPNREQHVIVSHSVVPLTGGLFKNVFQLASSIEVPLKAPFGNDPGDAYEIVRAEYFEPDPRNPIDPLTFDPSDPDLEYNSVLLHFVEFRDRNGALQDPTALLDPRSTMTVRFSEPMMLESFRPYESFLVTEDLVPTSFGLDRVGRIVANSNGTVVTFHPDREIQFGPNAGTTEPVGFGPDAASLRFHIKSVPSSPILMSLLGPAGFASFVREGHRGVTDLGGQSLAFPLASLSVNDPVIDYSVSFTTSADPGAQRTGAVVHRFQGQPGLGATPTGSTGALFADVPAAICGLQGNVYGQNASEINFFANGFLSGAPVAFFQKIHDDFNPPPTGQFGASQFGASTPIGGMAVLGGAKLQSVYRAVDASPDYAALAGTDLDLYQISYAPFGGAVTNTILPDVSIHAGHTAVVPDTKSAGGIPQFVTSGLSDDNPEYRFGGHFQALGDPNTMYVRGSYNGVLLSTGAPQLRQLCYGEAASGTTADFFTGLPVAIDNKNLFSPPGSPSRAYHPLPVGGFNHPFTYNNGDLDAQVFPSGSSWGSAFKNKNQSLVIEYRVRVTDSLNPPATTNSFTFAVGVLSSALPRFRIFTIGVGCSACCDAANCANTCVVNQSPPLTGLPGSGGPPLDPDQIVQAVGPDVAAPGLACLCLRAPQNSASCAVPGFTETTPVSPNVQQVAYGQVPSSVGNNFGDGLRYYMVFDYLKRESVIRSPLVRVQPLSVTAPVWLEPIVTPPLSELPAGTSATLRLRAATAAESLTPFVSPDQIGALNGGARPFIQFEIQSTANVAAQLVPVFEEIVIPFRYG